MQNTNPTPDAGRPEHPEAGAPKTEKIATDSQTTNTARGAALRGWDKTRLAVDTWGAFCAAVAAIDASQEEADAIFDAAEETDGEGHGPGALLAIWRCGLDGADSATAAGADGAFVVWLEEGLRPDEIRAALDALVDGIDDAPEGHDEAPEPICDCCGTPVLPVTTDAIVDHLSEAAGNSPCDHEIALLEAASAIVSASKPAFDGPSATEIALALQDATDGATLDLWPLSDATNAILAWLEIDPETLGDEIPVAHAIGILGVALAATVTGRDAREAGLVWAAEGAGGR